MKEPPGHLEGLEPDNAITFGSWRHPNFLKWCDDHRAMPAGGDVASLCVVNGCFDMLHLGHVNLIQQAVHHEIKGGWVILVALLNSDASVTKLKGPHRPYVPLAARMWHVAMLRGVQIVAGFDETTPEEALAAIKPDILFQGEEYQWTDVPGASHCRRVVFLPETPGFRTSLLEQRIAAGRPGSPPRTA